MLPLNSKPLSPPALAYLQQQQTQIDGQATPMDKAQAATAAWSKKSAANFAEIKQLLLSMCVGVEICVYCENNEATDVEHVFPKKIYPERAFNWDNYLLACGKCNSHHKSDKFKIFNPVGSATVENVTPKRGTYNAPANDDALFINQRAEDPLHFIELDLENQLFIFTERATKGTREFKKAQFTIELLGLNKRGALIEARKRAAGAYVHLISMYVGFKHSATFDDLENAKDDFETLDRTAHFASEKQRLLANAKQRIFNGDHPTVFRELLRQRGKLAKTNALVTAAPEILTW